MKIGRPQRTFIVRIIDARTGESRNFSVYGEEQMDRVHKAVKGALELLAEKK